MESSKFEEITISEITGNANVSRMSFYRHFKTKEELLIYKNQLIKEKFINDFMSVEIDQRPTTIQEIFYKYYELFLENRETLTVIVKNNLGGYVNMLCNEIALELHKPCFEKIIHDDTILLELTLQFISSGASGLILKWVKDSAHSANYDIWNDLKNMELSINKLISFQKGI